MKKVLMLMLLLTLSVALVACGGTDEPSSNTDTDTTNETNEADVDTDANETTDADTDVSDETTDADADAAGSLTIEASNWNFDQDEYKVAAGNVTVNLKNTAGVHGIAIVGTDVKIEGDGEATAELEPGEYEIVCIVPCGTGHADMVAKLVVE